MREGEGYRHKTIDYLCRNWNYILRIIYLVPGPSRGLDCSRGTLITCLPQPGGQSVYGERFHVGSFRDSASPCQGVFMDGRVPVH